MVLTNKRNFHVSMFPLTRVRMQIHTDPTLEFFALDQVDISDAIGSPP
jgi:hypothetical protein